MQPFPSAGPPSPGRGAFVAVVLLTVGFVVASAVAVVEFVQLRSARERIEELEQAQQGSVAEGQDDPGDIIDEVLGEGGGGATDPFDLVECLGGFDFGFGGDGGGSSVAAIADEVEDIRELRFREPVEPQFLPGEETARRVRELFLAEYTPEIADVEGRILTALGAIPPGTDLRELRAETIGDQVAGFYDPQTGELVVRQAGAEISVSDRITLAHELDHALTDQALGIPLPDDLRQGQEDADLAALSVVEGDATLVMQRYSLGLGLQEQLEAFDPEAIAEAEAGLAGVPPYLQQELLFPYERGLEFVCALYAEGGWGAVDRAYAEPPTSTAQILFPERYLLREAPVDPTDPATPGGGWREDARLQLGAANLLWLFTAPGGQTARALPNAEEVAGDWGGGELELWTRGDDSAVGIALAERPGAEQEGRDDLCTAVTEWYGSSFQGDEERGEPDGTFVADGQLQDAVVTCSGDEVRIGIAPDEGAARSLVA